MNNKLKKKKIILIATTVLPLALIALCGYYKSFEFFCTVAFIYALMGAIVTPVKLKNTFMKVCCKFVAFLLYFIICGFIYYFVDSQNARIILVGNDNSYSTSHCWVGSDYTYMDINGVTKTIPIERSKVYIINNSNRKLEYYSVEYSNVLFEHFDQADEHKQIIEQLTYKDVSFYPDYLLCPPPQIIRSQSSSNTIKYVLMYVLEIPEL